MRRRSKDANLPRIGRVNTLPWTLAICLLLAGSSAYLDSSGSEPIRLALLLFGFTLALLLAAVVGEFAVEDRLRAWLRRSVLVLTFAILLTVGWFRPALRLSFLVSRTRLDALADRIDRGEGPFGTLRIGSFRIQRAEMRYESYVALDLDDDPNGPTSLVRSRNVPGNDWSHLRLSDDWLLFSED